MQAEDFGTYMNKQYKNACLLKNANNNNNIFHLTVQKYILELKCLIKLASEKWHCPSFVKSKNTKIKLCAIIFFSSIPSMTMSFFPFNSFENFCKFPVKIKKKQ